MEEKKSIKISLSTFLLIIAIIVIIIMAYFLYKLNHEPEAEEIAGSNNDVSSSESTINNSNEENNVATSPNSEVNSINYIEMTEENYKKYNNNQYQFKISEMINNNDNTVTIKGRVYKIVDLPTITKEQYQDLLNNKTITLMGYELKVSENEKDEDGTYGGYDLLLESTGDFWMKYYVTKNSDGTGTLSDYTESSLYESTDIYMQLTINGDIPTESIEGDMTLKEYLKVWNGDFTLNDGYQFLSANDEFVFENGNCTSILFTNL